MDYFEKQFNVRKKLFFSNNRVTFKSFNMKLEKINDYFFKAKSNAKVS
jgi:hypothetical protein